MKPLILVQYDLMHILDFKNQIKHKKDYIEIVKIETTGLSYKFLGRDLHVVNNKILNQDLMIYIIRSYLGFRY